MKKVAIALLLSSAIATPAIADDSGWYAGINVGSARVGDPVSGPVYTSTNTTVAGIQAGYQFTKNWGAELFYTGAGKFDAQSAAATSFSSGKTDVFGISAVGTLPIFDTFSLYGKLGLATARTSVSNSGASTTWSGANRNAATFGLGMQYGVTPSVDIRLGWDRYSLATSGGATAGSTDDYNSNVYTLGATYKF